MSLEKMKLENGLTIYNDRIAGARTNDVRMFVPFGSVDEEPGNEGVAHVFEHCVHLQTDMFADRVALKRFSDTSGVYTNASTSFSYTDYYANGMNLEASMVHLSQILQHTHFPEEAVAHELKAVRRELATRLDSPGELHMLSAMNAMYGVPYGRSIGGYTGKIDFDVDTLRALHERYYKLGNMALMVSGKATTNEVMELAAKYFEADAHPDFTATNPAFPTLGTQHRTGFVNEASANSLVSIAYPLQPEEIQRYNDNSLINGMACRAIGQQVFQTLRYERGLSYNGSFGLDDFHPNAVMLSGDVTTDAENTEASIAAIREVLARGSEAYTDEELLGTMMAYNYSFNQAYNSNASRLGRIESALEMRREPTDIRSVMRRIGKVGLVDIRNAIDEQAEYMATHEPYIHVTGTRAAIGDAERLIERDEIA